MKGIISSVLLLAVISLSAIEESVFPFTQVPPSSIIRAMGYGYIGVADIWHQSPLVAWENPAMPAMHDGIAIGYSKGKYMQNYDEVDIDFNSSMATIGYHGIGLTLPFYNASKEFGTYLDCSYPTYIGEGGGASWGHENARFYGISFNPLKHNRESNTPIMFLNNMDISLGINYTELYSKWYSIPGCKDYPLITKISSHAVDVGLLVDKRIVLNEMINLEASLGYKKFNIEDIHVQSDDGSNNPVGNNDIWGAGLAISLPTSAVADEKSRLRGWTENGFTTRILGSHNFSKNIPETTSGGMELGFLDTVFLRGGYNYNELHHLGGWTRGFGIRLHYRDLLSVEGNHARFPLNGYEKDEEDSWDFMLSFDGIKIADALFKNSKGI